jgi:hypothetical protein
MVDWRATSLQKSERSKNCSVTKLSLLYLTTIFRGHPSTLPQPIIQLKSAPLGRPNPIFVSLSGGGGGGGGYRSSQTIDWKSRRRSTPKIDSFSLSRRIIIIIALISAIFHLICRRLTTR